MIKFQPKKFWKLLRNTDLDKATLSMEAFAKHNYNLFYDQSIPTDKYTPIETAEK